MGGFEGELGLRPLEGFHAFTLRGEGLGFGDIGPLMEQAIELLLDAGLDYSDFAGPPSLYYEAIPPHADDPHGFTLQVWVPLTPERAAASRITVREVKPVELAATIRIRGPHSLIPQGYAQLLAFIEGEHYRVAGMPRELYWEYREDGQHLTEICFPVMDGAPVPVNPTEGN
ncbi:MAG TPA: GyrI-like domain-containing protein [bacterium]|nr:GyrI-like domain-containing protein [bacterium]